MKKFKFEYSKTVWILLSLVTLLVFSGIGWNIFNLIEYSFAGAFKIIVYALLVFFLLLLGVIVISIMVGSKYVVKDGFVYVWLGVFPSKIDVKDISCFVHFKKSNKLVAYYEQDRYTVLLISPDKYESFVLAVREQNPLISFRTEIDGEETPIK
jgi:hypothetical protein